jgi:endonuclease I
MIWRNAIIFAFVIGVLTEPVFAQIPTNYYSTVDTANAQDLRRTLHDVIDDHRRFPYTASSTDTWDILESADQDPNNQNRVLDIYRNASFNKVNAGNPNYQREHSWPKSYGFPHNLSGNYPYTDCHHLFVAYGSYNGSRGNKPYGSANVSNVTEKPTDNNNNEGGGTGTYPGNSNWTYGSSSSGRWEVWHDRRGDVARAMFYMDVRYEGGTHGSTGAQEPNLILTDNEQLIANSNTDSNEGEAYMGLLTVLLQWHEDDPVDAKEQRRNDIVYSYQGNRNPFIDHPEWVAILYSATQAINVWINEFHYDNVGLDQGEFVEVAGPANTDLNNWRVVGYNGANGSIYKTVPLNGTIPDQENGYGTLAFDFSNLQNSMDGIALVDPSGNIVHFLSYEGTFIVTGTGSGQIGFEDIGRLEGTDTPVGYSLQLSGIGTDYSSFTWNPPQQATRGRVNSGQMF